MQGYETDIVLKDGTTARVREAVEADTGLIEGFLLNLSSEALTRRFSRTVKDTRQAAGLLVSSTGTFSLVAERDGEIIGQASSHALGPDSAEIAVVILDKYHNLGIGTILLGQITEAANRIGFHMLEANVAPDNHLMIEVFRDMGFPTEITSEPGMVRITFPSAPSNRAEDFFEQREAEAARAAIRRFFYPKSVAVIGASRQRGTIGGELFRNLLRGDFEGPVYPVNPKAPVVQSVTAYQTVLECPGPVELALVVVPAAYVCSVARQCGQKGVKAMVVISAGFAETDADGEGGRRQMELMEICSEYGIRLIGPNCMGIISTDPMVRLNAQFAPVAPSAGGVGFLSQSGALGIAVIELASRLGLGMSSFVSVGNKADISGNDLLRYWETDERTSLILLYLESFGNPRKFAPIARRVAEKKPVVAVKSGRSKAGFRASQSHTGALMSASDITVDALFKQSGVIRTDTLSQMFDVAALLQTQPLPEGGRTAIITNAGGAGILCADACEDFGLEVVELSSETQQRLRSFLPPQAAFSNPVDMIASATAEHYALAIEAVANAPEVDAIIVIFVPPIAIRPEDVAEVILKAAGGHCRKKPLLTNFLASQGVPDLLSDGEISVPSYPFPEAAARALSRVARYSMWLKKPRGQRPHYPEICKEEAAAIVATALFENRSWLNPAETETLLGCYGIELLASKTVISPKEVQEAARTFGGKIALKAQAPALVHKTDAQAVVLDIEGPNEALKEAESMHKRLKTAGFDLKGFIVQPMAPEGVEMLVGMTNDRIFGPVVAVGAGGIYVELLKDVSVRLAPLTELDASEMISALRSYPMLTGYRGRPHADIAALKDLVLRIGELASTIGEIAEVDLNPVVVHGKGLMVLDARVRVSPPAPELPPGARNWRND